eukprot:5746493-Alexandrium_andersonii.AAC.1
MLQDCAVSRLRTPSIRAFVSRFGPCEKHCAEFTYSELRGGGREQARLRWECGPIAGEEA